MSVACLRFRKVVKHNPRSAIHMEKFLLTVWVGHKLGGTGLGDLGGRANSVSQVDGVSDKAPTQIWQSHCWLCG